MNVEELKVWFSMELPEDEDSDDDGDEDDFNFLLTKMQKTISTPVVLCNGVQIRNPLSQEALDKLHTSLATKMNDALQGGDGSIEESTKTLESIQGPLDACTVHVDNQLFACSIDRITVTTINVFGMELPSKIDMHLVLVPQ